MDPLTYERRDRRDLLAEEASRRGQSLQAYLLSMLRRQSAFSRNRQILREIEDDLAAGGGAGADAPDAAEVLARARSERGAGGAGAARTVAG